MITFNKICILALLMFNFGSTNLAQADNPNLLGWDLSYEQLMAKNQLKGVERLKQWLSRNPNPSINQVINEFKDERIISALLIERPVFYADKKTTLLFVKTKKNAYFWEITGLDSPLHKKISFSFRQYDRMYRKINSWKQAIPLSSKETRSGWEGYYAFLSTYKKGKARQMLLTFEDFFVFADADKKIIKPGRLSQAVDVVTEKIPALSASLFGNCKNRPSRISLIQIFGDPVECYLESSVCFNESREKIECPREFEGTFCFNNAGLTYSVKFNSFDLAESILIGSSIPEVERAASRLIPAYSWIQYRAEWYEKRTVLSLDEETQSSYQDDCLEIKTTIPNGQATALILGSTKITWKN